MNKILFFINFNKLFNLNNQNNFFRLWEINSLVNCTCSRSKGTLWRNIYDLCSSWTFLHEFQYSLIESSTMYRFSNLNFRDNVFKISFRYMTTSSEIFRFFFLGSLWIWQRLEDFAYHFLNFLFKRIHILINLQMQTLIINIKLSIVSNSQRRKLSTEFLPCLILVSCFPISLCLNVLLSF